MSALAILAFGLALTSIWRSRTLRSRVDTLAIQVQVLEARLVELYDRLQRSEPRPETAADAPPVPLTEQISKLPDETFEPLASPASPPLASLGAPPRAGAPGHQWEQVLAENWLVWLGGLTLALGGAFLVKLSIDYGLLTPTVRIVLGLLVGVGLVAGAERVAKRETASDAEEIGPSHVPQALAAAGAATIFASFYAAYQLYHLLSAVLAFPLLAGTAIATVVMSLRHGPLVAALGLAGAYLVPLLVHGTAPHALPLFGYLTCVTAASLAVLRHRAWWWLAWLSLAGIGFWVLLWLGSAYRPETWIVGGFLLLQLALFRTFRHGVDRVAFLAGVSDEPIVRIMTRSAFWLIAAMTIVLVHVDGFGDTSLAVALLAAIFLLWFAYRDTGLDDVIAAAGALLIAVLATWNLPLLPSRGELLVYARQPVEVTDFAAASLVSALLLGGGGFLALSRAPRPGRWAALSAAAPILILLIAYWRVRSFDLGIGWSTAALALAAVELAAAAWVACRRSGAMEIEIALAAYAVGVLGATILAATFALSNAWLTVALALHLPAIGWVEGRIRLPVLRWLASGMAGVALVRLVLNPYLLSYPLSSAPIFNWLLYGYGVPAIAFIVATRQFGSRRDDALVWLLEAGSIAFSTMLLTLEIRHALYGRLDAPLSILGRDAVQTLVWLGQSAFLLWIGKRRARPVLSWGGIILFTVAMGQAVIWQALLANPLFTGEPVGRVVMFDVPTLAYALPALLNAAIVWLELGPQLLRSVARVAAAGLAFLWLTLEVRHGFRGEILTWGSSGEAEWYAYSVAWLAFAGAGLAVGLAWRNSWLRRASLAGVGLVIAKVFLSDMAALGGVLRALSFLGLGAVLVGIGHAYRRLRPLQAKPPPTATV